MGSVVLKSKAGETGRYGAAGGVGQIMARWAEHLGAHVIGAVSKENERDAERQVATTYRFGVLST